MADDKKGASSELWASILANANAAKGTKAALPSTIVLLGDCGVGKSSLVQRMKGEKGVSKEQGTGLEYSYIDVREEDSEDVLTRIGVYSLDGLGAVKSLLASVITKDTLASTLVIIAVDMSRPWTIMTSLTSWTQVIDEFVQSFSGDLEFQEVKRKLSFLCQTFGEKFLSASDEESALNQVSTVKPDINLGLPVIVVATKCDASASLEKNQDYRTEHFDYIQYSLRKYALTHGAAIVFTGKDGKNIDVLTRYLTHLAFKKDLTHQPTIADRYLVFVPIGWDSAAKLDSLATGMKFDADSRYEDTITAPVFHASAAAAEVVAEDEQDFLKKQLALLGKPLKPGESAPAPTSGSTPSTPVAAPVSSTPTASLLAARTTPSRASGAVSPRTQRADAASKPRAPVSAAPGAAGAAAKPAAPGAPGANNDVLASFFNSLLTKKPAGTAAAPTSTSSRPSQDASSSQ